MVQLPSRCDFDRYSTSRRPPLADNEKLTIAEALSQSSRPSEGIAVLMQDLTRSTVQQIIGPYGPLTAADLPPPDIQRWSIRRKAEVVAAIRGGLLSLEEASSMYTLSAEEFSSWEQCLAQYGFMGLRTTRTQYYPTSVERRRSSRRGRPGPECNYWPSITTITSAPARRQTPARWRGFRGSICPSPI
jgi:Protein of unknown function (DUF1153)